MLTEKFGVVSLLGPTADYNGSTFDSDSINMKNYSDVSIFVSHKGGTTGKSTLTLLASAASDVSSTTALAFAYRRKTTGASAVWGAIQAATSAGIDTVPGEDTLIEIFVKSDALPDGKPFINIHGVEAVNDPVVGAIFAILGGSRYAGTNQPDCLS